jgi:hypothetical protein
MIAPKSPLAVAICAAIDALRDKVLESIRAGDLEAADRYVSYILTLANEFSSSPKK